MAAPSQELCGAWATTADLCSPCDEYAIDAAVMGDALDAASYLLYVLSGRRWTGECTETVRPCAQRQVADPWPDRRVNALAQSTGCGCNTSGGCGCSRLRQIRLRGPIVSIGEVLVDGAVVPESEYRVDDYRYLVRLPDAGGTNDGWPCCQRLDLATTEDDTFAVTYTWGVDPPTSGRRAAAILACELAMACDPELVSKCRLPHKTQSITRQGLTVAMLDPQAFIDDGRTGLYEVDLFLEAVNPSGARAPAVVLSPDIGPSSRRAGT